jgi:adenine/guanine phosphoribosyltransferase-like PRPP-binding protein
MERHTVHLPTFIIDSELSRSLRTYLPDLAKTAAASIAFTWEEVRFFDDYTLLKLVFLQMNLRAAGKRVSNVGFAHESEQGRFVLRQLWFFGLPELIASGHLIRNQTLRDLLDDEVELLESNPLRGISPGTPATTVTPILCSHNINYFTSGSREEKLLDLFIRTYLRPRERSLTAWDLIESREFRHLIIQQLRRNVQEHSRRDGTGAMGLATIRIWTSASLVDEWALKEREKLQLLRLWADSPVASLFPKLSSERALLQVSVVDDGVGIPNNLEDIYRRLINEEPGTQVDLFGTLHYTDAAFEDRFQKPGFWTDPKATLIAFATDILGTSKPERAPEEKGLEYLRRRVALKLGGSLIIESDGAAIRDVTSTDEYGSAAGVTLTWCQTGGTGVSLAVPMSPVQEGVDEHQPVRSSAGLRPIEAGPTAGVIIRVREYLGATSPDGASLERATNGLNAIADSILEAMLLPQPESEIPELRRHGLVIVDWGELPDSKRLFNYILAKVATVLASNDPDRMRPFVFANLPKGLCGQLANAIGAFAAGNSPTLVCAFTAEQKEAYWLGLQCPEPLPKPIRRALLCNTQRKLTDERETRSEAFLRDCLFRVLDTVGYVSPSDGRILASLPDQYHGEALRSQAFSHLAVLLGRSALFRQERRSVPTGEKLATGRFRPVFTLGEIEAEVRSLFLDKFRSIFTAPPVCFVPPTKGDGVRLPHSARVVRRYFRSDALVDSPIAMDLTQELTTIALTICRQMPEGKVDWVVSCTSPVHWFVNRLVDGLGEHGISCAHHIFSSYESIPTSFEEIGIHAGDVVLAFTDVISTGKTAHRIASSLKTHFGVRMAGLIALADLRTLEDRLHGPKLDEIYGGILFSLYHEPETPDSRLVPAYYVHPETVVPKRVTGTAPEEDFFRDNYAGSGPLVDQHAFFSYPQHTLEFLISREALRFGHFQHGSHHSEVFVDVEAVLADRTYRTMMVNAVFRYIIEHDIRLVIYPSHSSAYLLVDDLKGRFPTAGVEFVMACRTLRGTRGTNYALTRFSPNSDAEWKKFADGGVLIIDDAVCTGATAESIIAELARLERKYYEQRTPQTTLDLSAHFALHVVAFLNRLPRVTGDFWKGLSRLTAGKLHFSAVMSMPLMAHDADACPRCRLTRRLRHALSSNTYSLYAKEFFSWWIDRDGIVFTHDRRRSAATSRQRALQQRSASAPEPDFDSAQVLRLAGYLSAIERLAYVHLRKNLYNESAREGSKLLGVYVRARAAFLEGDALGQSAASICGELEDLLALALDADPTLQSDVSRRCVLEVLRALTQRYLRLKLGPEEFDCVTQIVVQKLAAAFDNRLVLGGVAALLDSALAWFAPPDCPEIQWTTRRSKAREAIAGLARDRLSERSALMVDWLDAYLSQSGKRLDSVGRAVRLLAECAQKGPLNHFYPRSAIDDLQRSFERPPNTQRADEWEDLVRRAQISTNQFFELLRATEVLRSASMLDEDTLRILLTDTEHDLESLRQACKGFLAKAPAHELLSLYDTVRTVFGRLYERWFSPARVPPTASQIISYFKPNLSDSVIKAWEAYAPVRLRKGALRFDTTELMRHSLYESHRGSNRAGDCIASGLR